MTGKFFLVEHNLQFGTVFLTVNLNVAGAFHVVLQCTFQVEGGIHCVVEIVTVYFNADAVSAHCQTACANNTVDDFWVFLEFLTHLFFNFEDCSVGFSFVFLRGSHTHIDGDIVGGIKQGSYTSIVVGTRCG